MNACNNGFILGYHNENWDVEQRRKWSIIRESFLNSIISEFGHWSNFKFPKFHDPQHDDETIENFGSFMNLDDMNMETIHQESKAVAHFIQSRKEIESKLLAKV